MPPSNRYDPPGGDYNDDDDVLDTDLNLNELDPQTTSAPRSTSGAKVTREFGRRIPLRNLKPAGRRRAPRDDDAEALQELVGSREGEDDEEQGVRAFGGGAGHGVEDEGLLGHRRVSLPLGADQSMSQSRRRRQRMGLLRSLPFMKRHSSVHLPSSNSDDMENDQEHNPIATRIISVGTQQSTRFPQNAVSNAKYTPFSFLPRTLYNEFKFFFNMYFLLVALSQILPALRIGYLSTYIAPLAFVISITLGKEAYDDIYRRKRDNEANSESYTVLAFSNVGNSGRGKDGLHKTKNAKDMSERKRSKRRKVSASDDRRMRELEVEEQVTEDTKAPSAYVTEVVRPSRDLKVGDVVVLSKDQRVPADLVILKSFSTEGRGEGHYKPRDSDSDATLVDMGDHASPSNLVLEAEAESGKPLDDLTTTYDPSGGGEAFIRTDQLDGETDWKLRLAPPLTQTLPASKYGRLRVTAGRPDKRVNEFVGTIELLPKHDRMAYDPPNVIGDDAPVAGSSAKALPLTIEHTAWANTVLASSTKVHAMVVYTGPQTRAAMSTSASRSKTGLLEYEINSLTKILCFLTAALSLALVMLERVEGLDGGPRRTWYVAFMRFLILFSTIVPISLRVNLDMGKSVYAYLIHRDQTIPGTVVRTSTIPEDLGRIEYLLSDKTGTLTRNEMELKKVHVGTVSYGGEAMEEVGSYVRQAFEGAREDLLFTPSGGLGGLNASTKTRREIGGRVRDLVLALALCHNVTPTTEEDAAGCVTTVYQASSPDEIAIVQWTEAVGLRLAHRDRKALRLEHIDRSTGKSHLVVKVEILNVFPFTSDTKRMGIIVRFSRSAKSSDPTDGEIVFYQKGADTVMRSIVVSNDWLDEETDNMAREGLRTLVIGRKSLTAQQYANFTSAYGEASLNLNNRDAAMTRVLKTHLEHDLDLLGVTGVEDKLQPQVKPSLELLRNAGIKIWMLTGDKVETARCVAVSSKLVSRGQYIHTIAALKRKELALDALSMLQSQTNAALLIDGQSLALYLQHHRDAFISIAVRLPAVIACRCSPTQKADVALLIRAYTKKRIACIGDGGNDVSMIQAADVGVGIVGKEGKQASLAADFSITQFAHITKLLVWHGRNSYKRSAKLAQFVIHRGLIISVCQTVFSIASRFEPIALYRDWLLVGYATVYTMMPVFSLVLDRDVDEGLANLYPELYAELTTGRSLSYRTFFVWVGVSIYQGLVIQGGSELLVPGYSVYGDESIATSVGFRRMVAVSYTTLVVNEILMTAIEIKTWHPINIFAILGTTLLYFGSVPFLSGYFDLAYLLHLGFWWRFAAILSASLIPVYAGKIIRRTIKPPSYRKVRGV